MVDEEPQHKEDTAHRPSSRASSKSKSKAGSDRLALEELDLVLPPTASTYNHTPEPSPEVPLHISTAACSITYLSITSPL
jgi:hypothetical protein